MLTVRAFGAELMKIGSGGSLEISSGGFRTWRTFQALNMVLVCVEINQCVGCTGEEPASPRHRRDACSTAWRCEFLTARPSQDGRVIAEK